MLGDNAKAVLHNANSGRAHAELYCSSDDVLCQHMQMMYNANDVILCNGHVKCTWYCIVLLMLY